MPWAALLVLTIALLLLTIRPGQQAVKLARVLAGLVVLASIFGVFKHVQANLDAGVLDVAYETRWTSLSFPVQLWYAMTKTVGPTPPLAAGVLAQAAFLTLLASRRHPATTRAR